jgi:Domain of unknown function (DUF4124)
MAADAPSRHRVKKALEAQPWRRVRYLALALYMTTTVSLAQAETYRYVDDQGTVVFTDNLKNIAPRYRQRAKVVHETSTPEASTVTSMIPLDRLPLKEVTQRFTVGGLTPDQSRTLVVGFCAGIVMFAVMVLSGSPALRLLMRWLLILLAIGTTASIYFSNDPVTAKATTRAKELEQRQQDKARQIERMEPAADESR